MKWKPCCAWWGTASRPNGICRLWGNLRTQHEVAVDVLNQLGGMAELQLRDDTYSMHGYSCPLAAVPGHPEVCRLAETLLTELVGVPVHEQCERGEVAHCCFVVPSVKEEATKS
jgi:hypothetical protein